MDARSVLRWLTSNKLLLILFLAFCAYPVVFGVYDRIQRNDWALMDIDAVLCGAKTLAAHHSPYAIHPACAGLKPAAYVYAPQVAQLFEVPIKLFGMQATRLGFVILILWPATLFLLWFALIKSFPGVELRYRWLGFGALTAITFTCANIGLVMHALVLASLMLRRKSLWPFTIVVVLCAAIKPTFLTYFVIFLFDAGPLWKRVLAMVWRCAIGLGVVGLILLDDGRYGGAWQKTLHSVTLSRQPGMGWFHLTDQLGVIPGSHLNILLALGFMGAMALSGMAVAKWGELSDDERLLLGMGLVPLMTPRILDYDMILIAPCAALLVSVAHRMGGKFFIFCLSWLFAGFLIFGIVTNMINNHGPYPRTINAMLLFGFIALVMGLRSLVFGLGKGQIVESEIVPTPQTGSTA